MLDSGMVLYAQASFHDSISTFWTWRTVPSSFSFHLPNVLIIKMFFRSSSASAAVAFAVATAGSSNPPDLGPPNRKGENFKDAAKRKCSITSNVSTLRVLSVLRHWVTKHSQVYHSPHRPFFTFISFSLFSRTLNLIQS